MTATMHAWHILKRTFEEVGRDRVPAIAAGFTFYGLLALFPALTALVSLYGLLFDLSSVQLHLSGLWSVLPEGGAAIVQEQLERIVSQDNQSLSAGFIIGLAVTLWSANSGIKALFDALNIAYEVTENRGFIRLNIITLIFTVGFIVFVLFSAFVVAALPKILAATYLSVWSSQIIAIGRWPALLLVAWMGIAILYRVGPSRPASKWKLLLPGSLFAALCWGAGSAAFSWYVANFGTFNETYGSLGAAIGLMTWIWLSAIVVLIGAELNLK